MPISSALDRCARENPEFIKKAILDLSRQQIRTPILNTLTPLEQPDRRQVLVEARLRQLERGLCVGLLLLFEEGRGRVGILLERFELLDLRRRGVAAGRRRLESPARRARLQDLVRVLRGVDAEGVREQEARRF